MQALDTTYLVDYLAEAEGGPAGTFLEAHEDVPLYVSTLALYEIHRGAVFADGGESVETLARKLEWVERLPFTESSAREAVAIEREQRASGEPVNRVDVLVAAVARSAGAELVTRDSVFERIDGLEVVNYDES